MSFARTWPSWGRDRALAVCLLGCAALLSSAASAQEGAVDHTALAEMSIEDLMNINVISVSKRAQRMGEAAAAVHVITAEDIRRSGANSLPELLRGVPGVSVARLDASKWAISIRGFNERFSNKLLVLVDGRSIYTPLFSGVYWEANDLILEDIARIEIIRGPGGTHWGANAVNGVINITTKRAEDAPSLLSVGAGTEERAFTTLRAAGPLNAQTHYRLSLRYADRDEGAVSGGRGRGDDWDSGRASFRLDYAPAEREQLMVGAELYRTDQGQTFRLSIPGPPFRFDRRSMTRLDGGHLLVNWSRQFDDGSEFLVKAYFDRLEVDGLLFSHRHNTYDVEMQHRMALGENHDLLWGAGYRYFESTISDSPWINTSDGRRTGQLLSAFVHDEMRFRDGRFRLAVGARLEYLSFGADNSYDAFEVQPSVRVAWVPSERHTLWASVSRAVRSPSETEVDQQLALNYVTLPFIAVGFTGSESFDAEDLLAFEVGYRAAPHETLHVDLSVFQHEYENLRVPILSFPQIRMRPYFPHIFFPIRAQNSMEGTARGFEVAAQWRMRPWWQLSASYSYLDLELRNRSSGFAVRANEYIGSSPRHQISLGSKMNLRHGIEFDTSMQYVDALDSLGIDAYWDLELRLGWQVNKHLEAEVVGHNLLRPSRPEFRSSFVNSLTSENERGVYAKLTWKF